MKTWRNSRGLPPLLEKQAAMTLAETPATIATATWLAGSLSVLVLSGGVGCGKTLAAAHALSQWPRSGRWISAVELATCAPWDADIPALIECALLVIDDLGVETANDSMRRHMDRILDARINHENRTIITTNIKADEISARYGARFRSRLVEHGNVIGCGKTDLRETATRPRPLDETREPDALVAPVYVSPERVEQILELVHVGGE